MNETRSFEIAHAHALRRICTSSLLPNLAQLNHSLIVLAHPAVKAKAFLCFEDGEAEIFAVGVCRLVAQRGGLRARNCR